MKIINKVFIVLIIFYLIFYFANAGGYYEYTNYVKTELTEKQIDKFESDVRNGNKININDYMVKTIDYSNKVSKNNLVISNFISNLFSMLLKKTLGILNEIIE